ncbi:threonine synthase [Wohlfahrtiimonas chitiniclastica]|uniref:threonine synthase n=1 Tax=Wohlfahrtiimonas chitiniclastica TaxID=400946 RepID=UPI001BD182FD|nr:threonine synthase [Wohlfahrtiimonas chitiniclastica]MBS7829377.1 threonine synthase [Wohlfahrtiimonas chitiniclastica]
MQFISTRGKSEPQAFSDVVLEGLAKDGGLAMPETVPTVDTKTLQAWQLLSYPELAFNVMSRFITDIPADDLKGIVERAYTAEKFGIEEVVSLSKLNEDYVVGLSNGPTFAFKDMAMQFLGELFPYLLEKRDQQLNIVGATSGDTGSSAIHAMRGKPRINVFMLSPFGRMSDFQTAQMYSVQDENVFNIAVEGVFDDCQDLVKALNNDAEFKAANHLGAVNSINWARILAQIVYYFKAYLAAAKEIGEPMDFVIPSGNFGNIFAGIYARAMGLPIRKLILATNENNVLDEFFKTGIYRPRASKDVHLTSSPSMDIAKASNFERFIYLLLGADRTRQLWEQIETQGYFDLTKDPIWAERANWNIESGQSLHDNRVETIRKVYDDFNVVVDPHTADGIFVAAQYKDAGIPQMYLETAQPIKFAQTVEQALGFVPERPADYAQIEALPQRFEKLPVDAQLLKQYVVTQLS